MRLKLGQELWITQDGELVAPWVTSPQGPMRGATVPSPRVLEKGTVIYVDMLPGPDDGQAGVPLQNRPLDSLRVPARVSDHAELLAEMGHQRQFDLQPPGYPTGARDFGVIDLCGCRCKGCGTGWHCHDHRCFPLSSV
jgi:hypothetical protein